MHKEIYQLSFNQLNMLKDDFQQEIELINSQITYCLRTNDVEEYIKCCDLLQAYKCLLGIIQYWLDRKPC